MVEIGKYPAIAKGGNVKLTIASGVVIIEDSKILICKEEKIGG